MLAPAQIDQARSLLDEGYAFYIASNRRVLGELDTDLAGIPATVLDVVGAPRTDWDVNAFMRLYNRLNGAAFKSTDLGMPMWVMLDLGLLPSAFILITMPYEQAVQRHRHPADADEDARLTALLDEAKLHNFTGPIPLAAYCAAATPKPGHWIGWSLCSALTGQGHGSLMKAMGLHLYRAQTVLGITQFDKKATRIHRKFGRMRIVSATVPFHTVPHTYIYETEVDVADDRPTSFRLPATDLARQAAMQANIDAGTHAYYVLSPGLQDGQVPIHQEEL